MSASSRGAGLLIGVSLVVVAGSGAWYGHRVWEDSGWFVAVLFGIPVACSIGALWAELASRRVVAPVVVGVLAVLSLVWSVLTAGGIGLVLLVPSLLLVVAALVSWADRRPDPAGT